MAKFDDLIKSDKQKRKVVTKLDHLRAEHKSSHGKGTVALSNEFVPPDVVSTGIPELDFNILAIGGIALGRAIEIGGETNAGKTTLGLNIVREAIKAGLTCIVAENEGTFTEEYAARIGMPPGSYHVFKGYKDRVKDKKQIREYLSGPEFLEEIFRLAEIGYDLILIDSLFGIEGESASVARLTKAKMNTKQSGAQLVAMFAKLWKNGWKPLTAKNKGRKIIRGVDSGVTLITINHLKPKFDGFGKETPGSRDIQFLYSQRIWLERQGMSWDDLDENGNPIYTKVRVRCQKTKLSPGGRYTDMYIDNRNGRFITDKRVVVDIALRRKILIKFGSWYKPNPLTVGSFPMLSVDQKWQGADQFISFCETDAGKPLFDNIMRFGNYGRKKAAVEDDDSE